jgi:tRNA U34 5-methylaminomethyl-2-thiouridine-forming methyltransferase MnmC
MPEKMSTFENALDWVDDTIPKSVRFDDTYYSKTDGHSETDHVFIQGNNLGQRLLDASAFSVGELGFGTGLNFLTLWRFWRELNVKESKLTFVSFELYPISKTEIMKALSRWSELQTDAEHLFKNWNPDFEFFQFEHDDISLTVFFSDANIRLPQLDLKIDAWFLDGFSPAKNPELWNTDLMRTVFDKTNPHGTFATYTSAGWVRRNLQATGFQVERVKGHAGKRQMTIGKKVPLDPLA